MLLWWYSKKFGYFMSMGFCYVNYLSGGSLMGITAGEKGGTIQTWTGGMFLHRLEGCSYLLQMQLSEGVVVPREGHITTCWVREG